MPDKKSYWSGVVSGLMIAAFLVCGVFAATKIYAWIGYGISKMSGVNDFP